MRASSPGRGEAGGGTTAGRETPNGSALISDKCGCFPENRRIGSRRACRAGRLGVQPRSLGWPRKGTSCAQIPQAEEEAG